MAKLIDSTEFENEVIKSDVPVIVDFFANWCGPCKIIAPFLEEISQEMAGKAKVVKVDIDQSNDLAVTYNIRSVPTVMFFKNGDVADKIIGAVPKDEFSGKITALL